VCHEPCLLTVSSSVITYMLYGHCPGKPSTLASENYTIQLHNIVHMCYCSYCNTVYSLTVAQDATSWTVKLGEKKMAYINICAAVGHVADCDPSAAVCVKETGQSANPVSLVVFSCSMC